MKDPKTNELLDTLMKCITACETCADACLDEVNVDHMKGCIRMDRDCADICTITARFIARNSMHAPMMLEQCIALCKACEDECRKHEHAHCLKCADACHECHQRCAAYLSLVAHLQ